MPTFEFPFSIEDTGQAFSERLNAFECLLVNEGEVDNGLILELRATGTVINPIIYNEENGEFFGLNYTLENGDLITINTNVGEKAVTLTRDGVNSNLINYLRQDSTWLKAVSGDNVFAFACKFLIIATAKSLFLQQLQHLQNHFLIQIPKVLNKKTKKQTIQDQSDIRFCKSHS